jgi:hypothetical protein
MKIHGLSVVLATWAPTRGANLVIMKYLMAGVFAIWTANQYGSDSFANNFTAAVNVIGVLLSGLLKSREIAQPTNTASRANLVMMTYLMIGELVMWVANHYGSDSFANKLTVAVQSIGALLWLLLQVSVTRKPGQAAIPPIPGKRNEHISDTGTGL